jgi:hypothetical protein
MARSRSLAVVLVVATTIAGALVPSPSQAGETAGRLTMSVDSVTTRAEVGFLAQFPTKLRRPVVLERRARSGWVKVTTGRTNRRGVASIAVRAPSKAGAYKYRVTATRTRVNGRVLRTLTTPVARLKVTAPPDGTVRHPFEIGTEIVNGSWRFALDKTDTNAWQWLQYGDPANGRPPPAPPFPGWSYITVPVTFTNLAGGPRPPMTTTDIDFLGSDGVVYDDLSGGQSCSPVPGGVANLILLGPDLPVTAIECAVVPTAVIAGGLWRVNGGDIDTEPVFFKTG